MSNVESKTFSLRGRTIVSLYPRNTIPNHSRLLLPSSPLFLICMACELLVRMWCGWMDGWCGRATNKLRAEPRQRQQQQQRRNIDFSNFICLVNDSRRSLRRSHPYGEHSGIQLQILVAARVAVRHFVAGAVHAPPTCRPPPRWGERAEEAHS